VSHVSLLDELTDLVTLIYHEARNVRHLVRAKVVESAEWKYLIALPTNRYEAWAEMQEVRRSARLEPTAADVLQQVERRFRVDRCPSCAQVALAGQATESLNILGNSGLWKIRHLCALTLRKRAHQRT